MDPLTVTAASVAALTTLSTVLYWRGRASSAEAEAAVLRLELQAERHAASHDPLTGLPNRRAFYQMGAASLASPIRHSFMVVLVDLDDFKRVNDDYGHAAGDEVLVTIARRFAAYAGDNLVARLGGDEFVGLLTTPPADEHWQCLASLRLAEFLSAPIRVLERDLVVTASVGLAPMRDDGDLSDAVRQADTAMYQAKSRARDTARYQIPDFSNTIGRTSIFDGHIAS
ncbi:MAG: GGDEF domain-containing protein [Dactylosporangium sp.]|nr:GGDEF domain-containing protein [Dactylosporangium sp.]NNJ62308.1 GGDEF domain-containing protein [Dactylosporangium sp.]